MLSWRRNAPSSNVSSLNCAPEVTGLRVPRCLRGQANARAVRHYAELEITDLQRTAVFAGSGSGIGREVTGALLGAGYAVALAGRREQTLAETAGEHEHAR